VKIDCGAPTVEVDAGAPSRTAGEALAPVVQATDSASGMASAGVEVNVDGAGWVAYEQPVTVGDGHTYRFRARGTDIAGNVSSWAYSALVEGTAAPVQVDPPQPPDNWSPPAEPPPGSPRPEAPTTPVAFEPPVERLAPTVAQAPRSAPVAADPGLRIVRAKAGRRTIKVTGTVVAAYPGVVTVRVRATSGRSAVKRVRPRRGRFEVRLRWVGRGRPRVSAETSRTPGFEPGRASL
jgi:hypothetical protein